MFKKYILALDIFLAEDDIRKSVSTTLLLTPRKIHHCLGSLKISWRTNIKYYTIYDNDKPESRVPTNHFGRHIKWLVIIWPMSLLMWRCLRLLIIITERCGRSISGWKCQSELGSSLRMWAPGSQSRCPAPHAAITARNQTIFLKIWFNFTFCRHQVTSSEVMSAGSSRTSLNRCTVYREELF